MVAAITPKTAHGIFRVPVERAFSAKGYGTIVAGIPACGSVAVGDEVVLLPQQTKGRVCGRSRSTAGTARGPWPASAPR